MATMREWFEDFAKETGEEPESIVFGWDGPWGDYKRDAWPALPDGLVAFSDLPAAVLDKRFDSSYGANEAPNLCAWSKSWVLFSDDYDGAESLCWVPRNPIAHDPIRPGGG